MVRVYSQSLGCPKNRVDTERLLGSLGPDITTVAEPEEADLVFINTCAFIQPAVEESVRTVVQMVADLDGRKDRPVLAVGGCLPGRYGVTELSRELPEVDLWLHTDDIGTWPHRVAAALRLGAPAPGRLLSTGPSYAWLKIGEGCRHHCSFCTIPSIRGRHRSGPVEELEDEARALLSDGVRELVLVAQDVTAWGEDRGSDLRPLLDRLLPLPGLARLRLMYLYPAGLTDDLLDYLAGAGAPFVPYFDVPLQHAHPDVLGRMGRPFAADPQAVVDRIRARFPDAALRTTMMVGFPGETEEHFQTLMNFVERNRFHHLGVFAYQAEEGTPAATMSDQVPVRVKEARRDALMSLQNGISEDILAGYEGERLSVLVDAPHDEWPGLYTGRVWFQAPEVDGVTYVSGPGSAPGALVDADIVETRDYDLVALA
ncbi:MAG: 30S ribosomal protein S12 methylthiotransferase RimO [Desulfovibrionaceae bacterium]|nr:MAG: 30S ribosomal protein S12 methylthiotransferase RimO [Desulfovibrionaceae bacterium]